MSIERRFALIRHNHALEDLEQSGAADGDVITWDDAANMWVPAAPSGGSSYTDEEARDAVGAILNDTTSIDFTYTDSGTGAGTIEAAITATYTPFGRESFFVPAAAILPSPSSGSAPLTQVQIASGQPALRTLNFDASSQEYAEFEVMMPKRWDEGTITFKPVWSHAATDTNFGVVWDLQAIAISDDDSIAANFGTAQTSTDTGGTTDDLYVGPESSAITIAGSPAAEDWVAFRISRVTGNGSDTMAIDARLHGVIIYYTTNAGNDT